MVNFYFDLPRRSRRLLIHIILSVALIGVNLVLGEIATAQARLLEATSKPQLGLAQAPGTQATATEAAAPTQYPIYLPLLQTGAPSADTTTAAQLSTPALINQAFDQGEITADERVLYLAYALYEPQSLPARFHSDVGWYGTQFAREVQNYVQSVNAATTDVLQQELGRMNSLAATVCNNEDGTTSFDSAHFHFVYNTIAVDSGLDINDYSTSMETTFNLEIMQYGWAKPPLCTGGDTCSGATNPWGKYPVQIFALGSGLYGYVAVGSGSYTGFIGDNPNTTAATETAALASCMVLNDDFSQFFEGAQAALDATTAHEFVHAIQFGYGDAGNNEDSMWYESSAAYMEDEVFDSSNSNHFYLWPVITNSLGDWPNGGNPAGISQYSNFLFFRHVAEHNGGTNTAGGGEDIMQHFWENLAAGQAALTAYNNALTLAGTNLADAFHAYAIAAKHSKACGSGYAAPYCFEEGAAYVSTAGGLPNVQGSIAANPGTYAGSIRNNYAANWVSLPTASSPYQVTLNNTASGGQLRGSLVCDTGSAFTITPFPSVVSAGSSTSIANFDPTACTSVIAVLTNQQQTDGTLTSAPSHSYTLVLSAADLTPPTVTHITADATNGTYGSGAVIDIQVTFSTAVVVVGTPQLTLETGASDAVVNYFSGSGSNTLVFRYTVAAGQNSADLDYASSTALALNDGTIKDAANNNATLTLPTPGATGSLGATKDLIIDTTSPAVTINQASGQADSTATSPINFTVVFNEVVTNFATGDVTLSGTAGATSATVTGSGTTYNVAVSGMTTNGTVIAAIAAGVATDAAENVNTASTTTDNTVTFVADSTMPSVGMTSAVPNPTNTSPILVTVQFSENVTGFTAADIAPGNSTIST